MSTDDTSADETTDAQSLSGRATRGAMWAVLGFSASQILRLGGNLILTRLLFEEAFGLMALVQVVQQGLLLFSDIGIGPSVVQNKRQDDAFLNTAFTLQAARGVVLTLIGVALGQPVAAFYGEPELAYLLPFVSLTAFVAGFNSTRVFTLSRKLSLGQLQVVRIVSQAVGLAVMILWALAYRSVWALAIGAVATSLAYALMTHIYLPGIRNRLAWEAKAARSQIRFGRWIFVSTALSFLTMQSDRLVFGKLISVGMLGVYSIGAMIAALPTMGVALLSQKVLFPAYTEIFHRDRTLGPAFHRARKPVLLLAGWAFSGLLAGGPTAARLLYDERYHGAGWAIQALSIGGWFFAMALTHRAALLAIGRPEWLALSSVAKLLGMFAFIPAGYYIGSGIGPDMAFPGAVLGFSASEVLRYATTSYAASRSKLRTMRLDLVLTPFVAAVGALGAYAARLMANGEWPLVIEAGVIAVGVSLIWMPLGWPEVKKLLPKIADKGALSRL